LPDLLAERTAAAPNTRQQEAGEVRAAPRVGTGTRTFLRGLTGVLLLAGIWEVAPRVGLVNDYFVPPLSQVLQAWWDLFQSGELAKHVQASVVRSASGFFLAIAAAIPLGGAIAWYRLVREVVTPPLELFRNTAPLALLPVFLLILGIGETSKIAIVTYACFFPVLLNTISGVSNVDPQLLRSARVLGLSPVTTFRKVVFPAALPTIFTGVRIAGATAVLVLIAAEMIGATAGLGYYINYAQNNFLIAPMYAAILTTSALGLCINYGLVALERRLSRWRA
jgi:NitT/TauT family transport system permease protein